MNLDWTRTEKKMNDETHKAVGSTSFAFVGDISHVSENHRKGNGEHATDRYHGKIPPCVNMD